MTTRRLVTVAVLAIAASIAVDARAEDAAKPDAAKPDAAQPEAAKPEAQPDAAKPEAAKPEAAKPEAAKPEAVELGAVGPAPIEEPPPPPSDDFYDPKNPPAWATAPPSRRGGFAMGVGVGIGFGASNGFPNDAKKIGFSEYYTETGVGLSLGGTVWIGGALGDWVNFGFGGGYADIVADGTRSPAPLGCFHADVYPLFLLGGPFRDLGATFDFGLSFPKTVATDDEEVLIDGGMSSYLFAGAFWEGISAWQLKMGPYLGAHYVFSDAIRRPSMLAGFRVTVYSQP